MTVPSSIEWPQELITPALRRVVALLGVDQVRLVGGAVRNALLGAVVDDMDLATTLRPEDVSARLVRAGIKVVPTGLAHGTVTAVVGGESYEITTLRVDRRTDGRHAEVEFSTDWLADANRRDFTMNALYADLDGRVYDPLGCGLRDLAARQVRFVGDPDTRITEDYLRILRFFRFTLFYGNGRCDDAGFKACARHARGLRNLSLERVTMEMRKILLHPQSYKILEVMFLSGVLPRGWARFYDLSLQKRAVSSDVVLAPDLRFALRLISSFGFRRSACSFFSKILILNKKERSFLERIPLIKSDTNRIVRKKIAVLLAEQGRDVAAGALISLYARQKLDGPLFAVMCQEILDRDLPNFPVRALDIMGAGHHGEAIGQELARLKRLWAGSEFALTRAALLKKIRPAA